MATQSKSKGNPASKRMTNEKRKARRHACWLRGQDRKRKRREANEDAHKRNQHRRASGELTPWERAKTARAERRAEVRQ